MELNIERGINAEDLSSDPHFRSELFLPVGMGTFTDAGCIHTALTSFRLPRFMPFVAVFIKADTQALCFTGDACL